MTDKQAMEILIQLMKKNKDVLVRLKEANENTYKVKKGE